LNTILSTISDGILVLYADDVLVHENNAASQILGIPSKLIMGKQAESLLSMPPFLSKAVSQRTPLTDVEGIINVDQREINCLISLDFVFKSQNELQWIIVTLRSGKKVRKLVQSQVGANASLTLDDIPGDSPQLHRVRSFVRSAAGAQASILIRGEVGTGKNALASAIHNAAYRKDGPFVVFSCSSIPNELVISELLGYEEGDENRPLTGRPSKF
jgi:transcriptional regulator with PAS, ATPase and Fis domain